MSDQRASNKKHVMFSYTIVDVDAFAALKHRL